MASVARPGDCERCPGGARRIESGPRCEPRIPLVVVGRIAAAARRRLTVAILPRIRLAEHDTAAGRHWTIIGSGLALRLVDGGRGPTVDASLHIGAAGYPHPRPTSGLRTTG